jgi:hypothetical protein
MVIAAVLVALFALPALAQNPSQGTPTRVRGVVEKLDGQTRHCQLKRPWYARRVGGAAARVGELLCSPIMLPRSSRAGPEKGALGPLS